MVIFNYFTAQYFLFCYCSVCYRSFNFSTDQVITTQKISSFYSQYNRKLRTKKTHLEGDRGTPVEKHCYRSTREYCIQMGRIGLPLVPWKASSFIKTEKKIPVLEKRPRFSPGPTVEILPGTIQYSLDRPVYKSNGNKYFIKFVQNDFASFV